MKLLAFVLGVFVGVSWGATLPIHEESKSKTKDINLLEQVSDDLHKAAPVATANRKKRQSLGTAYAGYGSYDIHQHGTYQYAGYGIAPGGPQIDMNAKEATSGKDKTETTIEKKKDNSDCDEHVGGYGFGNGGYGFGHGHHGFGHEGYGLSHGGHGFGYNGQGLGYGGYGYGYGNSYGNYRQGYDTSILGNILGIGYNGYGQNGGYGNSFGVYGSFGVQGNFGGYGGLRL